MVRVGVHVSIAGSLDKAAGRAKERGCDCFQIFTKNPRGWAAKEISEEDARNFIHAVSVSSLSPVFAHMPYLPNLASEKPEIYQKSTEAFLLEMDRCSKLHIPYLVTHLGHAGDSPERGRERVVSAIREVLDQSESSTRILLENTAGERNSVGSSLEDIREVLDGVADFVRVGLCFDTCHAFAAGYELRTDESVALVEDQIRDLFGPSLLELIHLNDTKGDRGSGLDRHEHIGLGVIGMTGMHAILTNPFFASVPMICETPIDDRRGDEENLVCVRTISGIN